MCGMMVLIFFMVMGLVFIFLLLWDGCLLMENKWVKKGLIWGFFLFYIGYLFKINFLVLFIGYISFWVWMIDVLYVIGLVLIGLIVVCVICEVVGGLLVLWMLFFGVVIFLIDFYFMELNWDDILCFFVNFIICDYGFNFMVVFWLGFVFFGGVIGYILSCCFKWVFLYWFLLLLLVFGYIFMLGFW